MSPKELISKARELGILLYVKEGKLAFKARDNKLSQELRQDLALHKEAIIAYLSKNVTISALLEKYRSQRLIPSANIGHLRNWVNLLQR